MKNGDNLIDLANTLATALVNGYSLRFEKPTEDLIADCRKDILGNPTRVPVLFTTFYCDDDGSEQELQVYWDIIGMHDYIEVDGNPASSGDISIDDINNFCFQDIYDDAILRV